MKISHRQIEKVRVFIMGQQEHKCPLCHAPLRGGTTKKKPALDHDHDTGFIRGVLCLHCNGMEGKIIRAAQRGAGKGNDALAWLHRMIDYLDLHSTPQWSAPGRRGLIHPLHKTENDKRLARLAKAKAKRRAAKLVKG